MPKGESRLAGLVCAGLCLVLACSGCVHPNLRQRGILRGDPSSENGQFSWDEYLGVDGQGRLEAEAGLAEESRPEPDNEPDNEPDYHDWTVPEEPSAEEWDSWTVPEEPNAEEPDGEEPCPPESRDTPATFGPGFRHLVFGIFRVPWGSLRARMAARQYHHPRFHPLPLRPAFLPRVGAAPPADLGAVPGDGQLPATSPGEGAPQIDILLPSPPPEELLPQESDAENQDRMTRLHRRLETASRPGSWIYSLTPDRRSGGRPVSADRGSVMDYGK